MRTLSFQNVLTVFLSLFPASRPSSSLWGGCRPLRCCRERVLERWKNGERRRKTVSNEDKSRRKKTAHLFSVVCRLVLRRAGGVTERARALAAVFRVVGAIVDDGTRGNSQGNAGERKGTVTERSSENQRSHVTGKVTRPLVEWLMVMVRALDTAHIRLNALLRHCISS